MSAWAAGRADRVEGRPLSPRAFRHFGIEAVVLGPATAQDGLVRREGVAIWRRLEAHAPVFDRVAEQARAGEEDLLAVRVVVATMPSRDRAIRVPALGERAARAQAAAAGSPPATAWLLLVDEGPGETWLYLAEEREPAAVLAGFLGRRGRTDFARARRRSRAGRLASLGIFAGLLLVVYGPAARLGAAAQILGGVLLLASLAALVHARPR
jgi:hypothetical protein